MRNQEEIYRALLDGEILVDRGLMPDTNTYVRINKRRMTEYSTDNMNTWQEETFYFNNLENWSIYKEPNKDEEYLKS